MKKYFIVLILIVSIGLLAFRPPIVNGVTEIYNKIKDSSTNSAMVIDYEHHEVHSGSHFSFCTTNVDFDIADTMSLVITTPNTTKWTHFVWEVTGALTTFGGLYEGTSADSAAEPARAVHNNNRNSSTVATTTIHTASTNTPSGTMIDCISFGISTGQGISTKSGGGSSRGGQEWILDQNTKYQFYLISGADDNNATLRFSWYEHTNKN